MLMISWIKQWIRKNWKRIGWLSSQKKKFLKIRLKKNYKNSKKKS
jgi:hypothetical protein